MKLNLFNRPTVKSKSSVALNTLTKQGLTAQDKQSLNLHNKTYDEITDDEHIEAL